MERTPLPNPPKPEDLLAELRDRGDAFLLQSAEGPRRLARYSFLGFDPEARLMIHDGTPHVDGDPVHAEPADAMRKLIDPHRTPDDDGYAYNGGLVGYLSYEYAALLETLPPNPPDPDGLGPFPHAALGLFLDGIVYDHERRTCFYFTHDDDRSHRIPLEAARERAHDPEPFTVGTVTTNLDAPSYADKVHAIQDYIRTGHTFQTVLARTFQAPFQGSPVAAYRSLLDVNPSPYMFFLALDDTDLFGASPEMLVRVENDRIETHPIAGTRPLGQTPAQTRAYEDEMLESDKENAEHAMLVDLARNDVGRVARPGTVEVESFKRVERYSHVQHMVSRVAGTLLPHHDALDALEALFPAGTVTGAPKVRSMEIIQELEDHARGPYAGCIGYASLNGNLDTAITIRSAVARHGRIQAQAGAGIVEASDPKREHEETQAKGDALLQALETPEDWA